MGFALGPVGGADHRRYTLDGVQARYFVHLHDMHLVPSSHKPFIVADAYFVCGLCLGASGRTVILERHDCHQYQHFPVSKLFIVSAYVVVYGLSRVHLGTPPLLLDSSVSNVKA